MKKRPKVFISYAKENLVAARRLYDELSQLGAKPWLDVENLLPGQSWKLAIEEAIKKSDFIIFLLSPESVNKRGFVQKELKYAIDVLDEFPVGDIYIIPVRLSECQPRHSRIRDLQWVDLFPDWGKAITKISKTLELSLKVSPKHNLNGTWVNNFEIETTIEQNREQIKAYYRYPRFYAASWAMQENFPKTTLEGILNNDIIIFRFQDPVEKTIGIGFWKVEGEDRLSGYWFWQTPELSFKLVLKNPEIIINKDTKEGNRWELRRKISSDL